MHLREKLTLVKYLSQLPQFSSLVLGTVSLKSDNSSKKAIIGLGSGLQESKSVGGNGLREGNTQ